MAKKKDEWSMEEWRDYYEGLRQKAYYDYQESGMARYDRREHQYGIIVAAFDGYIDNKKDHDTGWQRRRNNILAYYDKLQGKDTFTLAEVKRILDDVSMF